MHIKFVLIASSAYVGIFLKVPIHYVCKIKIAKRFVWMDLCSNGKTVVWSKLVREVCVGLPFAKVKALRTGSFLATYKAAALANSQEPAQDVKQTEKPGGSVTDLTVKSNNSSSDPHQATSNICRQIDIISQHGSLMQLDMSNVARTDKTLGTKNGTKTNTTFTPPT